MSDELDPVSAAFREALRVRTRGSTLEQVLKADAKLAKAMADNHVTGLRFVKLVPA